MVTANVVHRILHIGRADSQGTAFTVDHGGKQYLVTARHVVEGIASGERISVAHQEQQELIEINVVGVGEGAVDVAVLACQQQLSPMHPLEPTTAGLVYGQQAYFLGFPFGWDAGGEHINHGLPLPFVKAGVISAWTNGTVKRIYIDSHVNEGFSPHFSQSLRRRWIWRRPGCGCWSRAGAVTVEGSGAASESSGWTQLDWPSCCGLAVTGCLPVAGVRQAGARARRRRLAAMMNRSASGR